MGVKQAKKLYFHETIQGFDFFLLKIKNQIIWLKSDFLELSNFFFFFSLQPSNTPRSQPM